MSNSGNDPTPTVPTGRRARNRIARHEQIMSAASEIVSSEGLQGLTMQSVADRVDCAVGTIYTYFDSKSSLLTALQIAAIETLGSSFRASREMWDEELATADLDDQTGTLVRLVAFGHLFINARSLHPREFELLQALLSSPQRETSDEDAMKVLPPALGLIDELRMLIETAVAEGALDPDGAEGTATDGSLGRTIRWAGALNGALLVSNIAVVPTIEHADPAVAPSMEDVFDGRLLALRVARDFLLGWGARAERLAAAEAFVAELAEKDRLIAPAPSPEAEPAEPGANETPDAASASSS